MLPIGSAEHGFSLVRCCSECMGKYAVFQHRIVSTAGPIGAPKSGAFDLPATAVVAGLKRDLLNPLLGNRLGVEIADQDRRGLIVGK